MEHVAVSSDSADSRSADMYKGFVPCPPDAVTDMDIFGVCPSRDMLGIPAVFLGGNGRVKVNKYLRGMSFVAIFDPHIGPVAEPDGFGSIPLEFYRHESAVKNSLADFNKTALQDLRASGSEWLMVDGICISSGVRRITYSDGSCELISDFIERHIYGVKKVLMKKGVPFRMETVTEIDEDLYEERFARFTEFVLRRYGDRIILNCASASDGIWTRTACTGNGALTLGRTWRPSGSAEGSRRPRDATA